MPLRCAALGLTGAAGTAALTGCGAAAGEPAAADQTLTVLAAASLTDVLEQLATDFEARHPGVTVELSFAGSSAIVQQVTNGAEADVLALAGQEALAPLPQELRVTDPVVFATNTLQIAVPPGNPAGIEALADLAADDVTLVVCQPQVPCGAATEALFEREGLRLRVASYEPDVRATLSKVALGEADAGVVYRTDVLAAAGRVAGVDVPAAREVPTTYPALAVSDDELAVTFIDALLSEDGRQRLAEAGFGLP